MARQTLCVTDLGTGFCYDTTTDKINAIGGLVCEDVFPNDPNDCSGGGSETLTEITPNINGSYTYTNEASVTQDIQVENTSKLYLSTDNGITVSTPTDITVPNNVSRAKIRLWGAGGAGGGTNGQSTAGAGGSGGYTEAIVSVTPGDDLTVIIGEGGDYEVDGAAGDPGGKTRIFKTGSFDLIANGGLGGQSTDFVNNPSSTFNGNGGLGGDGSIADATDVISSEILEGETGGNGGFLWYPDSADGAFLPFPDAIQLSTDLSGLTPPGDTDGLEAQYRYMRDTFKATGGVPPYHPGKWGRGGDGKVATFWSESWDNIAGTNGYITIEWM